jgi:hypothetical protein
MEFDGAASCASAAPSAAMSNVKATNTIMLMRLSDDSRAMRLAARWRSGWMGILLT